MWIRSEHLDEVVVECLEVLHLNLKGVMASLSVVLELVSVNVCVQDLGLSDKMHEFVLCFGPNRQGRTGPLVVVAVVGLVDEMLVTNVDLFSVHKYF